MGDSAIARRCSREDIVLLKQVGINPDRRPWRRAADRRHAEAARRSRARSSTACASPTRPRSRSSRWCCPARSTRRSSTAINTAGGLAVGLSGKDADLIRARKKFERTRRDPDSNIEKVLDLGFVGEPVGDQCRGAGALPQLRHHPGDRADRRRRRRRDLQHQRRHGGGRGRGARSRRSASCC